MDYVTLVSYSVLINGTQSGFFRPRRGLRQGDPLSPYLFKICTEGLISLLNVACASGELRGINMGDNTTTFSHLMFADDTLLLGRALVAEVTTFMNILKQYEI
ncbi:hypothetical protein LIER_42649 [Lithospermum erythrorhizon]|uniref:Reverse transcriptase domain-containing protein n=1 Tax=Lithospermum erythrorhizon TaxID=34254 RepID=A0AAV3NP47_LITER